jgi:DNA-binding transcriptional LysR family regulator
MRARQIEVFRTIMRCGTLTEAARTLNVSQPALSQVLLHAEDELGFKLFERVKGRLVPTPEAEELFPEADRIFTDIENLRRTAGELKTGRRGTVRLAASAPPALSIVPAALDAFRRKHSDIRILSFVVPSERMVLMLDAGAAGLGLAMTDAMLPLIDTEVVGHCSITCLVPEAHPLVGRSAVSIQDLTGQPLISYRCDTLPAILLDRALLAEGHSGLRPDIEVELSIIALAFVQGGLGVALVDDLLPWHRYPGIRTIPFLPRVDLPISILTSARRPLSRPHQLLRENLRREIRSMERLRAGKNAAS